MQKALLFVQKTKTKQKRIKSKGVRVVIRIIMSKKVSRIIGGIMLILAVAFLFVALGHPEISFPWGNGITYTLYAIYALIMVVLFIAPFKKK